MHTAPDLTRHDSGDVIGARLTGDVDGRRDVALDLIERAITRWALHRCRGSLADTVVTLLEETAAEEPVDVCLRMSVDHVTVTVAGHQARLGVTPGGCIAKQTAAA